MAKFIQLCCRVCADRNFLHLKKEMATLKVLALISIISFVCGRPPESNDDKDATIILNEDERDEKSHYQYIYETSNGIIRAETGDFEPKTFDTNYVDIKGYYSYVAPDGVRYTVTYVADENGFQPKIHKSPANQLPEVALASSTLHIDGVDDDRIGTKLLTTLGGGGFG